MEKTKAVKRSFYINISLLVVTIVSALLTIVFSLMFFTIKSIYFENFQRHTVDVNNFVAAQINGDQIEEYSKTFNKDAYYFELNDMLYRLKAIFEIKYLYILADTGDPGTYTYIFDAIYDEKTQTYDDSQYGVSEDKSVFPESQSVLETGIPFEYATYSYTEEYGRLFYSYSPITNSKGEVVAFLGTDISAEKMFEDINNVMIFLTLSGVVSFIVIFLAVMLYCKEYVSKPIIKLSADVATFSEGELGIEIPEKLLNRNDELGLIYRSFRNVIVIIGDLMRNLDQTVNNVIKGNIDAHIYHENIFRGSYENIAESVDLL
ncbi:MAG: hypothetical protein FWG09_08230, partial [Synergistaceae bacterium]|nr:hypothetical protein [Synergistaceae bacterium]